jgi:serine/threonine protein kinase
MKADHQDDSLDRDLTRVGNLRDKPRPDSSLGDLVTGADLSHSISDLTDFVDDLGDVGEVVNLSQRYDVADKIGAGGMGEVLRATDRRLKRPVAIKRLRNEFGGSRKAMQRFLTEATSVAALNHYNVVQIYDFGRDADGPFLVMELVDGKTLADRLEAGPLPLEEAVELTTQLCGALQAAHDRGIVHRDVKPANILLTADGIPKLTDFGLARQEASDSSHTQAGTTLGTVDFMSPEQRKDASVADARSDQWSLAATFYQMVTGEPPHVIDSTALPGEVRDVVLKALKTNSADRYKSVTEFGDALYSTRGSNKPQRTDPLALSEGQCASCGGANTTSSRFCKGCGMALITPCPSCNEPAPVWNRFCVNCGCDVHTRLREQLSEIETLGQEVSLWRADYRHEELITRINSLLTVRHPALLKSHDWLTKTYESLNQELKNLRIQQEELLQAAREQMPRGNLTEALQYLSQIPETLQTDDARKLQEELKQKTAQVRLLAEQIKRSIKERKYSDLEVALVQFLKLKPGDTKAQQLLGKVQKRSQKKPHEKNWPQESGEITSSPAKSTSKQQPPSIARTGRQESTEKTGRKQWPWRVIGTSLIAVVGISLRALLLFQSNENGESRSASNLSGTLNFAESDNATTVDEIEDATDSNIAINSQSPSEPMDSAGWTDLFQRGDLSGWKGLRENWRWMHGELIGDTSPGGINTNTFLCSDKTYRNFEVQFDIKLDNGSGNSGLQIRSTLADPSQYVVSGPQVDFGGEYWGTLYGERFGERTDGIMQRADADLVSQNIKPSEWNSIFVRCVGQQVTVYINGAKLIDHGFPSMPAEGILGWQLHSGNAMTVRFRNVRIRRVEEDDETSLSATSVPPKKGVRLINGSNLNGWSRMGDSSLWTVRDGVITGDGNANLQYPNWLSTGQQYSDFVFSFEYRIPPGGSSGIFLRKPHSSQQANQDAFEVQILDDAAPEYSNQPSTNRNGAVYGVVGPSWVSIPAPAGQWNAMEVRAEGSKVTVIVNGQKVVDANLNSFAEKLSRMPGLRNTSGYIGLQYSGQKVEFRNIYVEELK